MTKPSNRDDRVAVLIRRLLDAANMTQRDLAAKIKQAEPVVSRWINGHKSPRSEMLLRIIAATGHEIRRK